MKYIQNISNIKYLNLGCGYRFNSQWTNVDFVSTGKDVIAYDLSQKIPFEDNTFDLVYHSHVLEHFSKASAQSFIRECYRVLKPSGILRVVVPDLEQIARLYLTALDQADSSEEWASNYQWIALELLDQLVRDSPGGDMAAYLAQDKIPNKEFIQQRFGFEAAKFWHSQEPSDRQSKYLSKQIKELGFNFKQLLPLSLKKLYKALQIGYYRQNGEVHQWMYDRYSLSVLLKNCGLENIIQRTATESYIDNWTSYNLDTESDGSIYKPDSLFMEGIKAEC